MAKQGGYAMSFAHELNSLVFKMTISYFLYFWFYPKKDKIKYIPIVILAFITNASLYEFFDYFFHPGDTHFWLHFVANTLTYISFAIVFFTIYSIKTTYRNQVEIDKLTQEKQQAELNVLKAQINPHFLFNTLNTVYANALRKDDKTPDLILKLSDSFRYVMHDGQKEMVSIAQELQHLRDYIDLQQERLTDKVIIDYTEEIDNPEQTIPPLLLIGFIENAFKYTSILKGKGHEISIQIRLNKSFLSFYCQNPTNIIQLDQMDSVYQESGIGIKNTTERLQLLYPESHQLEIDTKSDLYIVKLNIQL